MITVPERPRQQTHHHQTRPRDQPRRQPKPKKPKQQKAEPEAEEGWYTIRDIIDEKIERGRILYLIDWEGTDQNGRRYDPTWVRFNPSNPLFLTSHSRLTRSQEPAANVTAVAINAWRDKKNEEASKAADALGHDRIPPSLESTQETDPAVLSPRRAKRKLEQRYTERTPMTSSGNTKERAHKRRRTEASRAASGLQAPRSESSEQQASSSSGDLDTGDPEGDRPPQPGEVTQNQGAKLVVELPRELPIDPSEFQIIASQATSQATVPEQARDQRVIPDSQEVSGTSVSGANNSYSQPPDLLLESQHARDPPTSLGPPEDLARASSLSSIPSRQPDPRIVDTSGFFANPNLSTNSAVNPGANLNRSLLHITSTGPFQGPVNESSPNFQTQLERDFGTIVATSSVTASHGTTIPESLRHHSNAQISQGSESQHSYTTNRNSTPSNSQAAQVVPPFISHLGEAVSSSDSDFSVFEEDRTVSKSVLREGSAQAESQDSSQALSELDGNSRISVTSQGHEPASSTASPRKSQPATRGSGGPEPRYSRVEPPQQVRPATPTDMAGTSAAGTSLPAKERFRLLREEYFGKSPPATSTSPAASSPVPSDSNAYISNASTPQAVTHANGEKSPAVDIPAPLISPILPLPSGPAQAQIGPPIESAQAHIDPVPSHGHAGSLSLNSYHAPPMEQPTTLDPSNLTLSIENVEGSPSVPTDDGLTSGPLAGSSNSDEDEMHTDYPRSLLPHVPTGPHEYLVTLPFQTSSRPQYNDIIRENEELMNEYNASFRVLPFETPRQHLIEKLDMMFSRLFDICDFPPFLESITSMSSEQITKHIIGTNAKFSFVAELIDNLRASNSDKKVLILVRPGRLMDLLGHVILSRGCRYIRSGQEVVSAADAEHPLTVCLSSTSDEEPLASADVDVVIAFDHTFRQELIRSTNQHTPVILALVNIASIQHLNMRIMEENLQPFERKNVLMLALVKAMRYVEEPDISEPIFSIAKKFARRIQMPEDDEDDFYWEPQTIPTEIFDDMYAASSQIDATQLSGQGLGTSQHPDSRKRSYNLTKRPKISQPQVVTSSSHISDAIRNLFGGDLTHGSNKATVMVSIDKLHALADQYADMKSKLEESKARETEFRQLSDRAQKEVDGYVSSINNIQTKYMDALKERGIFEADCKIAQEQASVLSGSLESCRTEITTLKAARTELEKKLAEANNALLNSSNPDLVKVAELEKGLNEANAETQQLKKRLVVMQSDLDYSKNLYNQASQRATDLSSENRGFENKIQELQRKADDNIIAVNKVQSRNEVRVLAQQVTEQKNLVRERTTELNKIREELKSLRSGRRETRQSSVPRSPRLSSLGVMSPRNGTRGPSAMGGPSSSRGTSPQPPTAIFDAPAGSGNGVQNAALFNQGSGANRFAHLRDQRF
ncbi:hypothetical protein FHL15_002925 [Xylaria flabelliformis]|uniref:Chromo domain-containing protein n=1 Tax=Xylaria flabelliformis TaxID=2512241 RepID=A0A553I7M2_9PEZI|nr:hypothetical protein FHL15_002925 [Xylaria flabelliformis]